MEKAILDLVEIESIKQLKARYFRTVDTFDRDGWIDCFTDGCHLILEVEVRQREGVPPEVFECRGRGELLDFWNRNQHRVESVHHGHTPEIDILAANHAQGIWAMEDIVEFSDSVLHGFGHYHETYRKVEGEWRIDRLHLTRTRISQVPKPVKN